MYSFYILLIIIIIAIVLGIVEYARHKNRINSIPIRIHINGTRGKSSVTRLIGAGLRAGGISTITKVTGTFPRLIIEDGTETYIHRKSTANIIEQLSIVKYTALRKAKALVMECMALQPQYQTITEKHMIRSNIGVMTNIRLDHQYRLWPNKMPISIVAGYRIAQSTGIQAQDQIADSVSLTCITGECSVCTLFTS